MAGKTAEETGGKVATEEEYAQIANCIPRLRRYARTLLAEGALADDLVQDTLERALNRLHRFERGRDMRAWLFSIMHNLYIDQLRQPGLAARSLDEADYEIPCAGAQEPLQLRDLQTALCMLPVEQREVLLLVGVEEMNYGEVAATLAIPLGTVMSRLSRGRERLRWLMEGGRMTTSLKAVK